MATNHKHYLRNRLKESASIFNHIVTKLIPSIIPTAKKQRIKLGKWSEMAREKLKNPAKANLELGKFFFNSNKFSDAKFRFKLATMLNKNYSESFFWLAKTEIALRKESAAKKHLQESLKLSTENKQAKNYLLETLNNSKIVKGFPEKQLIQEYFNCFSHIMDEQYIKTYEYNGINQISENLISNNKNKTKSKILDLGCGKGAFSKNLKEKLHEIEITGIDFSSNMIELAKNLTYTVKEEYDDDIIEVSKKHKAKKAQELEPYVFATLIKKDLLDINEKTIKDKFDYITSRGIINYIENPDKYFSIISKFSKKGSIIYFYNALPHNLEEQQFIKKEMTYPFFINKRFHSHKEIEKSIKKHKFKITQKEQFQLELKSKADLYCLTKL
jgi:predicted TPR repeat methyltransferase